MTTERAISKAWVILLAALAAPPAMASDLTTSAGPVTIRPVVTGLAEPWGMDFLPDGRLVLTERDGRLLLVDGGKAEPVAGTPEVWAEGQGGLLDVLIPRDFATSREVWLTYVAPVPGGGATAVGKGRLSEDGSTLEGFTRLWAGKGSGSGRHFGSRLAEGPDGAVYLTTGDRGTGPDGLAAQDPMRPEGKVIALNRDGSPAVTLPGHAPGVFNIGHRNAQGLTTDGQGRLWLVEHGAKGGDEVNRIEAGRNYGWPVITYGVNYGLGTRIGEGQSKPGMVQPLHVWVPSIAPSGMAFVSGSQFPQWQGDLLVGALRGQMLVRLVLDGEKVLREERLLQGRVGRIRDVRMGPDGFIYLLSDGPDGALMRLEPVKP